MALSFSLQTKEELARIKSRRRCCRQAELTACLRLGNLPVMGEAKVILLASPHAVLARNVYILAKELMEMPVKITARRRNSNGRTIFKVTANAAEQNVQDWLAARKEVPQRQCCQAAYLRGAFLVNGSVNKPSGNHHLEYVISKEKEAEATRLQLLMQQQQLQPRLSRRKRGFVLYLKDSEQIVRALSLMGAHSAVLAYEDVLVYKDMRNRINRLVNCDTANLSKTVETGLRQAENIRYLVKTVGWETIPANLQEIAALRLQHPEASLKELGQMLVPPLSKSGVNHRLRRLELLTNRIKEQKQSASAKASYSK